MHQRYIILLLLFFQLIKVSAQSTMADSLVLQTKVSIKKSQVSLFDVLDEIQENYNVNFSYTDDLISLDDTVNVLALNQPLFKVLDKVFASTSIKYMVVGKQIILVKDKSRKLAKPVIFLSVQVKDTLSPDVRRKKGQNGFSTVEIGRMKNIKEWRRYKLKGKNGTNSMDRKFKIGKLPTDSIKLNSDTSAKEAHTFANRKSMKNYLSFSKPENKNTFSLNFNFTLGSSFRKLIANNSEGDDIIIQRKQEKHKIGFNSEITLSYYFNKYFILRSGVGILNLGETGIYTYDDRTFTQFLNSRESQLVYVNNYTFITFPIAAGYSFLSKKISLKIIGGIIPSVFISNGKRDFEYYNYNYYSRFNDANRWIQQDMEAPVKITYRKLNFAYSLAFEGTYHMGRMGFSAGLSYVRFLCSSYKKSAPIKEKLFLPGMYLGLGYCF